MLSTTLHDANAYYQHANANTLSTYYDTIISNFVIAVMSVPINRSVLGMDTDNDPEIVGNAVDEATQMIANAFLKNHKDVETDLAAALNKLPIDDLRESRVRLQTGHLN